MIITWSKNRFSSLQPLSAKRLAWESRQLMMILMSHPAPRWARLLVVLLGIVVLPTAVYQFIANSQSKAAVQTSPASDQFGDHSNAAFQQFQNLLVAQQDIPAIIAYLLSAAVEEGLVLNRGTYDAEEDRAGRFSRYRMTLPVRGDAGAIEGFIDNSLVRFPALALDGIQISRRDSGSQEVEASIRWTLFTAPPAGADRVRADR